MDDQLKKIAIVSSVLLAIAILAGTLIIKQNRDKQSTSNSSRTFTIEEVNRADGKADNPCYVAISNIVYEIRQGNKWKDGEHIPSEGEAYCGQDATEVITKSPHGKSIISLLTEIGKLE